MFPHLPIVLVATPLLAAPLCVVVRRRHWVWTLSILVSWAVLVMAILLLHRVATQGPWVYSIGGWPAPWGIEYRIDLFNAFILLIVAFNAAICLPYAPRTTAAEMPEQKQNLFYAVFLLCVAGLLGIAATGDLFNVFVFLEISALSSYVLVSMGQNRKALTASYQYLVLGTIGSTFLLIGIGLLYMLTGTLNMADLAARLPTADPNRTLMTAFAFLTVGASIKMALFPLHQWLPNAYTYAPSAVSAFIASTSTKVSLYLFIRLIFTLFGATFVFGTLRLHHVLMPLSLLAILAGSLTAIQQTNVKRLLAYSSVAQTGYMVLGLSLHNVNGLTGGIVHMFNHAMIKGGMFLAVGCIVYRYGSAELRDLRGVGRRMPATTAALVIGGLGLIGVPMTSGFISKWHLVLGALDRGNPLVAILTLLSSLLAVIYVWKIVEVAYFQDAPENDLSRKRAPVSMLVPTWVMIGFTVVFGIHTALPVGIARGAALWLLGGQG